MFESAVLITLMSSISIAVARHATTIVALALEWLSTTGSVLIAGYSDGCDAAGRKRACSRVRAMYAARCADVLPARGRPSRAAAGHRRLAGEASGTRPPSSRRLQ